MAKQAFEGFAVFDVDGTIAPGSVSERAFWHMQQTGVFNIADADLQRLDELRSEVDLNAYHHTRDNLYDRAIRGVSVSAVRRIAEQVADAVMSEAYPEILDEINDYKDRGFALGMISGSPDMFVQKLKPLGFHVATGTRYFHNRHIYHEARPPKSRAEEKHDFALGMARRLGLRGVTAAFGNSMSDLSMLEIAEHPVAVNPDLGLREIAKSDPDRWRIIDCVE